MKTVILLTACINPSGMSYTALQNVELRKKQYIDAILFYLQKTNYNIVFCNNSGEDISSEVSIKVSQKLYSRIEFISFNGNDYNNELGKGYGEFEIIKKGVLNSVYIKNAKYILKITGRYIAVDVESVIKKTNFVTMWKQKRLYVDISDEFQSADARCFYGSKDFFLKFVNIENLVNDENKFYFEHLFYQFLCNNPLIKQESFYITNSYIYMGELISGMSGTLGTLFHAQTYSYWDKLRLLRNYCEKEKYLIDGFFRKKWMRMISIILRFLIFINRMFFCKYGKK